jgi:uroporphyrinogen decarboxylase
VNEEKMDKMTSRERLQSVMRREKPDRVPVMSYAGAYAAKLYGMELAKYYTDADICFKCQLLAAEMHGYDDGPRYGWADWGGWEFGGEISFPRSYTQFAPEVIPISIDRPADVEKIIVPNPSTAGANPILLRFNRLCRANGYPAKIPGGTVSTYAGSIIGKEKLLRWYAREPSALQVVYEKATQFILATADMMISEFGASNCSVSFVAPLESNDLISPDHFAKFGLVYLKKVIKGMKQRGILKFSLHICGNHKQNLPLWSGVSLPERSTISIGSQMDIAEVAAAFKHRHIIAGNIPTTTLATGTFDEVYNQARDCLENYRDLPGGYILMPACELPLLTPPLNVFAMLKAAWDYGTY